MKEINYDQIIEQLKSELNSQCAIANRYGIVLGSSIKEFAKGKLVPHKILELIDTRQEVADELNLNRITSFALESQEHNYIFTFSQKLILVSKLDLNVNLAKFMPSISAFLKNLDKNYGGQEAIKEFTAFDFSKEITKLKSTLVSDEEKGKKYSIIKELIKHISN